MMTRETRRPSPQSEIVEADLIEMLQKVIDARGGLSVIHQLLDDAKTMSEIRARFARWQAEHSKEEHNKAH